MILEAAETDLPALLELYLHLHEDHIPEDSKHLRSVWQDSLGD